MALKYFRRCVLVLTFSVFITGCKKDQVGPCLLTSWYDTQRTVRFTYNSRQEVATIDYGTFQQTYNYNADGLLTSISESDGGVYTMIWDPPVNSKPRLLSARVYTKGTFTSQMSFSYNGNRQLTAVGTSGGILLYSYPDAVTLNPSKRLEPDTGYYYLYEYDNHVNPMSQVMKWDPRIPKNNVVKASFKSPVLSLPSEDYFSFTYNIQGYPTAEMVAGGSYTVNSYTYSCK